MNKHRKFKLPDIEDLKKIGSNPNAEKIIQSKFWKYFKKNQSNLPLSQKLEELYLWLTSGRLSKSDKVLVVGAILYFFNPFDVIPDFTPFLGFIDDIGVAGFVYRYLQNRAIEDSEDKKGLKKDE